jgi:hypothetical protein
MRGSSASHPPMRTVPGKNMIGRDHHRNPDIAAVLAENDWRGEGRRPPVTEDKQGARPAFEPALGAHLL